MKTLITGGCGYIGSQVAKRIPGSLIIDHKLNNHIDDETLSEYLPKCDSVIHLAGTHYAYSANDCYLDLQHFITLIRNMRVHNVKRLILVSSASVYGDDVVSPVNEDHPTNPNSPYGHYKLVCEQISKQYEKDYGLKTTIIRPFNASGGLAKFIPYVKTGEVTVFGDGSSVRDFIHVEDLADAIVAAFKAPGETFNIGSGVGISLNEIIALKGNVKVNFQPERENDPRILVADISKAKRLLGWEPKRTIEDILC